MSTELLTPAELATMLKTSKNAVYRMVAAREQQKNPIPVIRLNQKHIRFSSAAIMQWLHQMQEAR
jgi:excisionase family DNA binding protein